MSKHYTAHACIIWCFDNRFWPDFHKFVTDHMFSHFDPVFVAGGAKGLADLTISKGFLLDQIEASVRLHQTPKVVLMTHEDCGAFGGFKAFTSREEERRRHTEVLEAAKSTVRERFPELTVETYYCTFEGPVAV